jgi:hypothetical protein
MATKKRPAKRKSAAKRAATPQISQDKAVARVISPALQELIGRAITDAEFRNTLFKDRARATKGYKLSKIDQDTLAKLTPQQIEEQAQVFAKKMEIYIFVKITIHF